MSSLSRLQKVRILYKTILRLHRGLPIEMKALGDEYVKSEFKRHKKCSDPEANLFLNEWTEYAITLTKQLGAKSLTKKEEKAKLGRDLDPKLLDQMKDEQIAQLYELMKAAKIEENR